MDLRQFLSSSSVSPQKILKIVLSVSVVLLFMWLFMVSRMEYTNTSEPENPAVQEARTDSLRSLLNQRDEEEAVSRSDEKSSNIFLNAFTTFLILVTLLGVVWFWSRNNQTGDNRKTREVDRHMLGQGAEMKIVEVNEEIWVLGVTSGSVNLLHRYQKSEWKEQLTKPDTDDRTFHKIFSSKT